MKDFFSPTAQARHHTVLHPPTSRSLPEKTILPLHPLEIRDLNGGVSSEKMDRTQLMCFFFPFTWWESTPALNSASPGTPE